MDAREVVDKCTVLEKFWQPRNKEFKTWYELIQMVDSLAQKDMESFVGNDPRASYNLMLSMLDQPIPHRIPPEKLAQEHVKPASDLSILFETAWNDVFEQYRMRGRYFKRDLIGFLLATGWYSVFATISMDGTRMISEVWHPATVYPVWDEYLSQCAHIQDLNQMQAQSMVDRLKWGDVKISDKNRLFDYWWREGDELIPKVYNAIVLGNKLVKPATHEARFKRIPIFIAPVGGLPDTGEMSGRDADRWKREIGQSLIATNKNIYNYWNKWWSFSLQLLRDTAQARTYEKTRSSKPIVKPEDWYKRGGHFRMTPEDDVGYISPPPIPIELRSSQLDMEAMMQRGGPSWAMFGNIQQKITAYVMSQIASSANQIAKAYHDGVIDCMTDIDNFWLAMMQEDKGIKPYELKIPTELPKDIQLSAEYEVRIPGDLIQRVTTARMMNPDFELSDEKIMDDLFPEIKSPVEEMAKVRAGKVRKHPMFTTIAMIDACKQEAMILKASGNSEMAKIYEKAAKAAEATIIPPQQQPQQGGAQSGTQSRQQGRPPGVRPEVIPPNTGLTAPEEAPLE